MSFFKLYIRILLTVTLVTALFTGCSYVDTPDPSRAVSAPTEEFVSAANSLDVAVSSSILEELEPLLNLYSTLEGVEISVSEIPAGSSNEIFISTLTSQGSSLVISDNIYNVNSLADRGGILQIKELDSALLASLAEHVPSYMSSSDNVAFLPVGIDGYGYICNTALLAELLEVDDISTLADNVRRASATQWQDAVSLLDDYISGTSEEGEILRLSSGEYTLPAEFPESIENLVAPYAMELSKSSVVLDPLSVMLSGLAKSTESEISPFEDYPEYIYAETNMTATPEGRLERGEDPAQLFSELTAATAVALYEQEKVLFYRTSLSDAFKYLSPQAMANSVVFPIKPLTSSTDNTSTYTLNAALTITTPFVFALTSDAQPEQNEAALDFLVWFYYSETGRSYISDTLGLLEFNRMLAKNPLTTQLSDYINNNNIAVDMLLYTDPQKLLNAQQLVYNNYLSIDEWDETDFEELTTALDEIFL